MDPLDSGRLRISLDGRIGIRKTSEHHARREFASFLVLDVKAFNPFAASYRTLSVPALYRRHEREKRARYEERVSEVEKAAFTPLGSRRQEEPASLQPPSLIGLITCRETERASLLGDGLAAGAAIFQPPALRNRLSHVQKLEAEVSH